MQAKQTKESVPHSPWAGGCSAIPRTAGLHHAQRGLGKTNAIAPNVPPSFSFPQLYMGSTTSYGLGSPLGQSGSAAPAVSPPTPCAPPGSSLVGWGEKQNSPWLWVSTAQQGREHPGVTNTVSSTNPKHSPIPATVKKTNSVPAEPSTQRKCQSVGEGPSI